MAKWHVPSGSGPSSTPGGGRHAAAQAAGRPAHPATGRRQGVDVPTMPRPGQAQPKSRPSSAKGREERPKRSDWAPGAHTAQRAERTAERRGALAREESMAGSGSSLCATLRHMALRLRLLLYQTIYIIYYDNESKYELHRVLYIS